MTNAHSNPYTAPSTIAKGETSGSRLAMAVMMVCFVLSTAMLIAQQFATVEFSRQGVDLPVLTRWFLNPLVVGSLFLCIAPVWMARSWENKWWRSAVCILVLLFAFFFAAMFFLSMYLPIVAIRNGLGL